MGINLNNKPLINVDMFVKEIQSFLPTMKYESIFIIVKRVIEISCEENFYQFLDGKGDYPDFFFMPDELSIKTNIYKSFRKEREEYLGKARYELIDIALSKQDKNNPEIEKEFYLFLRTLEHLFLKLMFKLGSVKDLPNLFKIFSSNLDYMVVGYENENSNLAFRSILLPTKYFNKNTNTLGYNKNSVDIDKIKLLLDFSDSGMHDTSQLVLEIYKILDSEAEMDDLAKAKFIELSTIYICLIIFLSNHKVSVCNQCGEIYIEFDSEEDNICSECHIEKHKTNKMFIFKASKIA